MPQNIDVRYEIEREVRTTLVKDAETARGYRRLLAQSSQAVEFERLLNQVRHVVDNAIPGLQALVAAMPQRDGHIWEVRNLIVDLRDAAFDLQRTGIAFSRRHESAKAMWLVSEAFIDKHHLGGDAKGWVTLMMDALLPEPIPGDIAALMFLQTIYAHESPGADQLTDLRSLENLHHILTHKRLIHLRDVVHSAELMPAEWRVEASYKALAAVGQNTGIDVQVATYVDAYWAFRRYLETNSFPNPWERFEDVVRVSGLPAAIADLEMKRWTYCGVFKMVAQLLPGRIGHRARKAWDEAIAQLHEKALPAWRELAQRFEASPLRPLSKRPRESFATLIAYDNVWRDPPLEEALNLHSGRSRYDQRPVVDMLGAPEIAEIEKQLAAARKAHIRACDRREAPGDTELWLGASCSDIHRLAWLTHLPELRSAWRQASGDFKRKADRKALALAAYGRVSISADVPQQVPPLSEFIAYADRVLNEWYEDILDPKHQTGVLT